jgi:regulator of replication initiation timing
MVKISANDFIDMLNNPDVKSKFSDIFNDSIQAAIQKVFEKVTDATDKLAELSASVSSLRLEIQSKDQSISNLKTENNALKAEVTRLASHNDDLSQELKRENLILSGFTPSFSQAAAATSGNSHQHISLESTISRVVDFCHNALALPDITSQDISSASFLPPLKSAQNNNASPRLLLVRFTRRCVRDNIFSHRRLLKNHNNSLGNTNKYYINEDLTASRRKLFAEARQFSKAKRIDSAWTSNGLIIIKTLTGRITAVHTRDELNAVAV